MMETVKNSLDKFLKVSSVVLFAALVLTVMWQVFSRQVLSSPSAWSEELARYLFAWLGFFATALVFSERGHISVDVLIRKLSPKLQKVVAVIIQLAIISFAGLFLTWGGLRAAMTAWGQNLTALPTTIGPLFLVMPITGVLIVFYAIYHIWAILKGSEYLISPDENPQVV